LLFDSVILSRYRDFYRILITNKLNKSQTLPTYWIWLSILRKCFTHFQILYQANKQINPNILRDILFQGQTSSLTNRFLVCMSQILGSQN
jgi:hypothetical protein